MPLPRGAGQGDGGDREEEGEGEGALIEEDGEWGGEATMGEEGDDDVDLEAGDDDDDDEEEEEEEDDGREGAPGPEVLVCLGPRQPGRSKARPRRDTVDEQSKRHHEKPLTGGPTGDPVMFRDPISGGIQPCGIHTSYRPVARLLGRALPPRGLGHSVSPQ